MTDVVIASAARTAIGGYGKSLAAVPPSDLGKTASVAALQRAGLEPEQVEHVVFGNVIHTEPGDAYMARVVGVKSGIPKETPAYTVNRLCGTGVQAIVSGAQAIQSGDASVVLTGGAESMSRGPYWLGSGRWGARMGDTTLIDPVQGALTDPFNDILMGVTAENLAERGSITRERQDEFAVRSHQLAAKATADGVFKDQIVPVPVKVKKQTVEFVTDEHIRSDASPESMAKLKPIFKPDGTVTAGNASGMNDAGAAVVLASKQKAAELGLKPRAEILAYASCGVDPKIMGIGPVPAVRKVLDRSGKKLDDVQVIELNEAFAAQALAVIDDLGLNPELVNPHGGAVAMGHPIGATGAALTAKILDDMEQRDLSLGLVTLCIGGGQGIALLLGRS
ncbi:MAG: acetyl-CoA C-acyltransferase [Solirubrobacterales bacterium]|nr:acetyl-CoA C-acyltransferase [Solirubrobacterales bacterium]